MPEYWEELQGVTQGMQPAPAGTREEIFEAILAASRAAAATADALPRLYMRGAPAATTEVLLPFAKDVAVETAKDYGALMEMAGVSGRPSRPPMFIRPPVVGGLGSPPHGGGPGSIHPAATTEREAQALAFEAVGGAIGAAAPVAGRALGRLGERLGLEAAPPSARALGREAYETRKAELTPEPEVPAPHETARGVEDAAPPQGRPVTSQKVLDKVIVQTEGQPNVRALNLKIKGEADYYQQRPVPLDEITTAPDEMYGIDPRRADPSKGPIVLSRSGEIIDGRHRFMLAQERGDSTISALTPIDPPHAPTTPRAKALESYETRKAELTPEPEPMAPVAEAPAKPLPTGPKNIRPGQEWAKDWKAISPEEIDAAVKMSPEEIRGVSKAGDKDSPLWRLVRDATGDGQRDRGPERMMEIAQQKQPGGSYPYLLEHVGDLTHRMSMNAWWTVKQKVERSLRKLRLMEGHYGPKPYEGFDDDYLYHVGDAAEARGVGKWELEEEVERLGELYADTHEKHVPVFNEAYEVARDAAIAVGRHRWGDAERLLTKLEGWIAEGDEAFARRVNEVDPDRLYDWARQEGFTPHTPTTPTDPRVLRSMRPELGSPTAPPQTPAFKRWFGKSKVVDEKGEPMVVYHGTTAPEEIEVFRPGGGEFAPLDQSIGTHFAVDPEIGSFFGLGGHRNVLGDAPVEGGRVVPVHLRLENPRRIPQAEYSPGNFASDQDSIARDVIGVVFDDESGRGLFVEWAQKARAVDKTTAERIFDTLRAGKPIRSSADVFDPGDFPHQAENRATNVADYISDFDSMLFHLGANKRNLATKEYVRRLKEQGYDGVQYMNTSPSETKGASDMTSYIVFDPTQVKSATGNIGTYDPTDPSILRSARPREGWAVWDGERFVTTPAAKDLEAGRKEALAYIDHPGFERRMVSRLKEMGMSKDDATVAFDRARARVESTPASVVDPEALPEGAEAVYTPAAAMEGLGPAHVAVSRESTAPAYDSFHEFMHAAQDDEGLIDFMNEAGAFDFVTTPMGLRPYFATEPTMGLARAFGDLLVDAVGAIPKQRKRGGPVHQISPEQAGKISSGVREEMERIPGAPEWISAWAHLRTRPELGYIGSPNEAHVAMIQMRRDMLSEGFIKDQYEVIGKKEMGDYLSRNYESLPSEVKTLRPYLTSKNLTTFTRAFNKVPAVVAAWSATKQSKEKPRQR